MIDTYIFIGMAGVGKSTIGSFIAKSLGLNFYDIDNQIAKKFNIPISKIIDEKGPEKFKKIESDFVLEMIGNNHILSPGGSFIYSQDAIEQIKERTLFIHLFDNPNNIRNRINNFESRGIIGLEDKSFEELYYERFELYKNIGNIHFNLEFRSFQSVCDNIISYFKMVL